MCLAVVTYHLIFKEGNKKFLKTLKNEFLSEQIISFKERKADPEVIDAAAESFLIAFYDVSKENAITIILHYLLP